MKVFTPTQARQKFSTILDCAQTEGKVQIRCKDGRVFILQPLEFKTSPLAVSGINLNITSNEIVGFIHESRKT